MSNLAAVSAAWRESSARWRSAIESILRFSQRIGFGTATKRRLWRLICSIHHALPDGSVMDIPAGYAGAPYKGVVVQIPGTVYARNYDVGGEGIAFHHPGAITCGDWPAGMALYRTGGDCVGLSVTNPQKPDITTTGAPEPSGEIYVSYTGAGQWMKYTVAVTQSATYVIGGNYATGGAATDPVGVVISFAFTPMVSSGNVNVPTTADHNHESYHVWETLGLADNIGEITVPAGIYVMTFAIVSSNGNFDTFTFTPKL
jgi:hypothetical protein